MSIKEKFIEIYNQNIKREGADKLLAYLLESDFFEAPASARYHSSYEGGLAEHSIKVYECLKAYLERERVQEVYGIKYSDETIAITALLHDLCKIGCYQKGFRNVKDEKGQWQRVAMARAFVSDAKYVILDEPTAALDPLAESQMYENFAKIFDNRGTIMISHRLASAKMADRILVLDGGRIIDSGSHDELMAKQGLYHTMFTMQSSFYNENMEEG